MITNLLLEDDLGHTQTFLLLYIKDEEDITMTIVGKEDSYMHQSGDILQEHQEAVMFQQLDLTAKRAPVMRRGWMMR